MMSDIQYRCDIAVHAETAGLFVSQGRGIHGKRVLSNYELIFVRRGELHMYEDDDVYQLTEGQTLILRPGHVHGGISPYANDLRFYWVHFTCNDEAEVDSMNVPCYTTLSRPDYMTSLYRMFLENQEADGRSLEAANLIIGLMLIEVAQHNTQSHSDVSATQLRLADRVKAYIRVNFDKPISTSAIASELDINPDYLGRVFHAVNSQTITDAIHIQRVKHAKTLLMETDVSIEKVGVTCGYENPHYFRRVFMKLEGMSPKQYRLLYCRMHTNSE